MTIVDAGDRAALAALYTGGWNPSQAVRDAVAGIVEDVRTGGDDAVIRYTRRWDFAGASAAALRVDIPPPAAARGLVPDQVATGLEIARERIDAFHRAQRPVDIAYHSEDGTYNAFVYRAISSVGSYVPGGTAVLPSSVLMAAVPAKIAGVERIVVVTPPQRDGSINPAILYACGLCAVDELYAVGGAQAIAALAYGTATIAPVDKIVGPGNVFVTEAKRQVFGVCGIDGLAGPSEVLVVADARAKPAFVAGEMLAQAEHDPLARVAAVSLDRALLEAVRDLLSGAFASETGRSDIVERVLQDGSYLIHARTEDDIYEVIERFAPEHLSLQVADPHAMIPRIRRAGAIFLGADTPVAAGDYIAGSNHTLPTSGAGRFSSGLRTLDFLRSMSIIENSRARMHGDRDVLAALANFEGLPAHARTALLRD